MSNTVEPLSIEQLESMHTRSLMTRRKKLLQCKETGNASDPAEVAALGTIEFKDTPEWQRAYDDLKQVLSGREHLPNKQERKAMRQAAAKQRR